MLTLRAVAKELGITPAYLSYIRGLECLCIAHGDCMGDVVPHHQPARGRSNKGDDRKTVPLCVFHHRQWHDTAEIGLWDHEHTIKEFAISILSNLCDYLDGERGG